MANRYQRTACSNGRSNCNWSTLFGVSLQVFLLVALGGCTCVGLLFRTFTVRGMVLSADTEEPQAGAFISVLLLRDGEVVGRATTTPASRGVAARSPLPLVTSTDGSFAVVMANDEHAGCFAGLVTVENPVIPDQVRIFISVDGCQDEFLIDLNEDTVVDPSFPDNVIELKDPILVPPCEQ